MSVSEDIRTVLRAASEPMTSMQIADALGIEHQDVAARMQSLVKQCDVEIIDKSTRPYNYSAIDKPPGEPRTRAPRSKPAAAPASIPTLPMRATTAPTDDDDATDESDSFNAALNYQGFISVTNHEGETISLNKTDARALRSFLTELAL